MNKQAEDLKDISGRYEHDKKRWAVAAVDLQEKIKVPLYIYITDQIYI